jgi:LruC domain-containing protein
MKTLAKQIIIFFLSVMFFSQCKSESDRGLLWLLALENGGSQIVTTQSSTQSDATLPSGSSTSQTSTEPTDPTVDQTPSVTTTQEEQVPTVQDDTTITDIFSIQVNDATGSGTFIFDTTKTIELNITVLDTVASVEGTAVRVIEKSDPTNNRVIFQAITDENGNVKGNFTINTTTNVVYLEIHANGQVFVSEINVLQVDSIDRKVLVRVQASTQEIMDQDGDGIADDQDDFPDDPTRATLVSYPAAGSYYTVAFEDLYPKQGDADFNDYVVRVSYQEELNSAGKLVNLRGSFQHVAKGAGYNHTFHLRLPEVLSDASYVITRSDAQDKVLETINGLTSQSRNIDILGTSNKTIPQSNTAKNQTFKPGHKANLEIHFDTPADKTLLGSLPFDLYIYVLNTKHEIHFAKRYFKENNEDQYIDPVGFPWAVMIPGNWSWPLESQNMHKAYLKFYPWYSSGGQQDPDWYNYPEQGYIFPVK